MKLRLAFTCLPVLAVLLCFNNCAPLGTPLGGIADLSSSGAGLGADFFELTVKPALTTANCASCHMTGGSASPSVLNYGTARAKMLSGSVLAGTISSINNAFINKLLSTASEAHTGGKLCANDTVSPCVELKRWAVRENSALSTIPVGRILSVSSSGLITGWAYNPTAPTTTIAISFYSGFAAGVTGAVMQVSGTAADAAPATGGGVAPYTGHYFSVQLPKGIDSATSIIDGVEHSLYGYAGGTTADAMFINSAFPVKAYGPTAAGMTYFNTMLVNSGGKLSTCLACHNGGTAFTMDYSTSFDYLTSPFPDAAGKGTSTNNSMILNAMGKRAHPGGTFCASAAVDPCLSIKTWWETEFQ